MSRARPAGWSRGGVALVIAFTALPVAAQAPVVLESAALPPVYFEVAAGEAYEVRGVPARVTLPAIASSSVALYRVVTTAPIALDVTTPLVPLRLARKVERGAASLARGAVIDGATGDSGRCKARLSIGDGGEARAVALDPRGVALAYDLDVPCTDLVLSAAEAPPLARAPSGYRRFTVAASADSALTVGDVALTVVGESSACAGPPVYGRIVARELDVVVLGRGQTLRGRVPAAERSGWSMVHILPQCPCGERGRAVRAIGSGARSTKLRPGTVLISPSGAAVARVTAPLPALVQTAGERVEIVSWDGPVRPLCRAGGATDCEPGLLVRPDDVTP